MAFDHNVGGHAFTERGGRCLGYYAQSVLPKLKTGVVAHDQKDAELIDRINAAIGAARGLEHAHAT